MIKRLGTIILFTLLSNAALAGPVFSLMGGGGISQLHPDGNGVTDKMALSLRFGIVGSGGGFMNGKLTLVDSYVLPTAVGGTTTISAADIQEFAFHHNEPILSPSLYPYLHIVATGADIASASGTIVNTGTGYLFTPAGPTGDLKIQTTLFSSWTAQPVYGSVSGDWRVDGANVFVGSSGLGLIQSNQAKGLYQFTGFSSVPEPSSVFILMSGLLMLGLRRKSELA